MSLPPWLIDKLRREKEAEESKDRRIQPSIEVPLPPYPEHRHEDPINNDDRGSAVIDYRL